MTDSPFQMAFKGFSLTPRMKEMGIVGLYRYDQHWRATFEKHDGVVFEMPLPVVQWLMEDGGNASTPKPNVYIQPERLKRLLQLEAKDVGRSIPI